MNFIVDAQLPPALADWLVLRGHRASAVRDLGLRDADDRTIWAYAREARAVIVTKDEDFAFLAESDETGPSVLWVRTGNLVNRLLFARFERAWREVEMHLAAGSRLVEIR